MNLLKAPQLRDVATIATATLATLSLATTTPSIAAILTLPFCGFFGGDTTGSSGQVLPGSFIKLDTDKTTQADNFGILDAKVTTTRGPNPTDDPVWYNFSDFKGAFEGNIINELTIPPLPEESIIWKLTNTSNDRFYIVFPKSGYDQLPNTLQRTFDLTNFECRADEGGCRHEPDRIPEPSSVIGTVVALGLGGVMTKKNFSKLKKNKDVA